VRLKVVIKPWTMTSILKWLAGSKIQTVPLRKTAEETVCTWH
jgi:hypothetical protein